MLGKVARQLPAVLIIGIATVVLALAARPIETQPGWPIIGGWLVALTLVAAGGALWFADRRPAAVAAALAGLSWAAVTWSIERVSGGDALVAAGMLLAPLLVPMLLLLVVGLPDFWHVPRGWTPFLVVASVVIAVTGIARVLVYEPILDLNCGLYCGHSPVLIAANLGLAAGLGALAASTTVVACGTIALGIRSNLSGRRPRGRDLPRVLAASGMGVLGVSALAGGVQGAIGATTEDLVRVVVLQAIACLALAVGALFVAAERLAVGSNLARIGGLLAEEGRRPSAEALLREAAGDPGLQVGYWTTDRGYVAGDGRPLDLAATGRQHTELTSRGRPVAIVLHDPRALSADLVLAHLGPEARLAIQNESLELQLELRLDELRASRRRVVEAGDAERRRLERDLHDGAQQLLMALSFEVRRGERYAMETGDEVSAALFAETRAVAGRILEQLRVLAHGIHPTILTNAGLEPALATYVRALDRPPRLTVEVPRRLPAESEASAYAIVTELIAAAPAGAETAYSIREEGDTIRIAVDGDIPVPDLVLDRLGAAGGSAILGERGPEFVLPCA